jgi:hypothetical protein
MVSVPACVRFVCADGMKKICKKYEDKPNRPCVVFRTEGSNLVILYCPRTLLLAACHDRACAAVEALVSSRFEPEEVQAILAWFVPENLSFCK